ncbi:MULTISPECIES: hypothetical protein [unclassified Streptomyces]|uniref:hypothetical protein n=1 Tax=unclassified Streptomyces TaxID=2593676 RepID=UPI002DD7AA28|nr:hypothetical protein [Streptomyces sp. NBC_01294]WRZ60918.1 hypothetical protein OG534_33155 [Streptomyces sp. NBC_01294]
MTTRPGGDPPFLTLHTAVVLLLALFAGLVVGGLSLFGGVRPALALLAGLTAAGAVVPAARGLIR